MKLHALLIGVDATPDRPLYGCVHDVDAVQRLVLDPRLGLPVHVTRLVSPQPGAVHDTAIAGAPATLAAIRAALAHLASDAIAADDRVFVYFSGHGARVPVPKDAPELYREALIPVDLEADKPDGAYRLLFDDEFNARLAAIARRTRGVTVVLDCCFAAGATRGAAPAGAGRARFVDLREHANACDMRAPDAEHRPLASGVDDCHVIAACLNHELASERPDARGITRGVLTQAFATAVAGALATGGDRPLAALTWAEIWQAVRAEVAAQPSGQHPWMAGNPARRVFGGPPVHGDAGVPIARAGDAYTVEAGTLAGVTRGAELAVYGHQPAYFPALGSGDDLAARLGVVRVVEAAPGSARAVAIGAPFAVPAGARSRVIAAGEQARLEVAIDPADHPDHPALAAAIAASPLLALAADPATADVRLVARAGAWHVGDALHPVCTLAAHQLDRARAVLEHYLAYARPIRMAAQIAGAGGELGDGLALRVLLVPREVRALTEGATRSVSDVRGLLPEARSPGSGVYTLGAGETICFEVHNQARVPLVVTLVNAAASGKVAVLAEHAISPGKRDLFWFRNQIFAPFAVTPPAGEAAGTDRVIAFGRAADQGSLGFLAVDHGFADVVRGHGAAPVVDPGPVRGDGGAAWTASQAVLHVQGD